MRLEYKFLIENDRLSSLRSDLAPFVEADAFAQARSPQQYVVRSIYFDTHDLECYFQKIEGIPVRRKLRIRGYNELDKTSVIFLEIKKKYGSATMKFRSPLHYGNLDKLLQTNAVERYVISENGSQEPIDNGRRFLYHLMRKSLRPTVLVVYDREPYYCRFNPHLRITLDNNLRHRIFPTTQCLFNDTGLKASLANHFILEIKFTLGFPDWLQSIIRRYDVTRQALSKYTICLAQHSCAKPLTRTKNRILSQSLL